MWWRCCLCLNPCIKIGLILNDITFSKGPYEKKFTYKKTQNAHFLTLFKNQKHVKPGARSLVHVPVQCRWWRIPRWLRTSGWPWYYVDVCWHVSQIKLWALVGRFMAKKTIFFTSPMWPTDFVPWLWLKITGILRNWGNLVKNPWHILNPPAPTHVLPSSS